MLDDIAAQIAAQYESGRNLLVALGAMSILIGAGFASAITRSITCQIRAAVLVAEKVLGRDLTSHKTVDSRDETGKLMSALKTINDNIRSTVSAFSSWPRFHAGFTIWSIISTIRCILRRFFGSVFGQQHADVWIDVLFERRVIFLAALPVIDGFKPTVADENVAVSSRHCGKIVGGGNGDLARQALECRRRA